MLIITQFDINFFDTTDTEQKAYIIGFLQCDGSFSCKTKDGLSYYRYKLAIQERDAEILFKIQYYLSHKGKITFQSKKLDNAQRLAELSLNGREFVEKLHKTFGGYKKDDRLLIPEIPDSLMSHYIRGVFDADGSFGDYGKSGVMLRFEGKKEFLIKLAPYVGFSSEVKKGNGRTTYTMRLNGSKALEVAGWLYNDATGESLYLERKYHKVKEILANRGMKLKEVA